MPQQLSKPQFVKVSSLVDARNGYNVYVKVVKAEFSKSGDGQTNMVKCVVADETGAADAFFKGEAANLIKEGAVIAIRNGTIKLIKSHISLEIDIFGRVTVENIEIKENAKENISEKEVERRRKPRKEREPRETREPREPREPRKDREDRPPRRDREDRPPRREREDREDRPKRQDREERPPRRDREDRPPRRDREEERPRREDREPRRDREDRPPRRDREDRPPRRDDRDNRDRRDNNEERPRRQWTKIGAIEPGDEGINIIAQVVSVQHVGKRVRAVLGDETGVVKAFLIDYEELEQGNTVALFKATADVVKEHIEVQVPRGGRCERARRDIKEVNETNDISAKEWVEAA